MTNLSSLSKAFFLLLLSVIIQLACLGGFLTKLFSPIIIGFIFALALLLSLVAVF